MRRVILILVLSVAFCAMGRSAKAADEGQLPNWGRFNYYPYLYYPREYKLTHKNQLSPKTPPFNKITKNPIAEILPNFSGVTTPSLPISQMSGSSR